MTEGRGREVCMRAMYVRACVCCVVCVCQCVCVWWMNFLNFFFFFKDIIGQPVVDVLFHRKLLQSSCFFTNNLPFNQNICFLTVDMYKIFDGFIIKPCATM